MQPRWFRNAVIYQVDPAMFYDSDGDGWGDLPGLTQRLDHVRGLGATCLWLLPFYPSPFRDGGYDLTDHLSVDPRFGDLSDVAQLLDKADDLGLRVLVDLVVQHTSVDHPWFQEARHDRRSPYRDFYVWADEPRETGVEPVFPDVEDGVWTWDEEAQQFYRHTFYAHEPDLEVGNPAVREQIRRVMLFWLRLGVSGFRVDAVPYLLERVAAAYPDREPWWYLAELRRTVIDRRPEAVLLGEVDVPVEEYADYYGDGDRLTMLLDFWTNNHLFLALCRGEAEPLARALHERPEAPHRGQYGTFVRNHDELDLERLGDGERKEVLERFAPDEEMRAYGRGIRRRLAPLLDGDDRRIAMAQALLLSLPGAPLLLYGDEVGMGDDLSRRERLSVRTPMPWSDAANAGFSGADPDRLVARPVSGGRFGFEDRNVLAQSVREDSLLSRVGRMVRVRTGAQEIGEGTCRVVDVGHRSVLALRHEYAGRRLYTLVNLSPDEVTATLPAEEVTADDRPLDILTDCDYVERGDEHDPRRLQLRGHGYRWLRRRQDLFG